ncbi:MAG: hypothetical protein NTZ16_09425 [Verrucomicrobia bacterium]|nr:hypothetical protein [Verrucomicrobiota bacterium]
MQNFSLLFLVFILGITLCGPGCHRKEAAADPKALEKSFETAAPEVKQTVTVAVQAIQTAKAAPDTATRQSQYVAALKPMSQLVTQGNLSKEQSQAVLRQFQEVNKTIQKDPQLARNKEIYKAQNDMVQAMLKAGIRP